MTMAQAREALAAGDFTAALAALATEDGPGSLELRAQACYGSGAYEDAVGAWEQLHARHRAAGETQEAAQAAVMTATLLLIDAGMPSTVRGWLRRAEHLLAGEPETPVRARIAAIRSYERFLCGDMTAAASAAAEAIRLGERWDDLPAVTLGKTATGRIQVLQGDVEAGLAQLDEVAALLISGEVDQLTTGIMFCELICAAQGLLRYDLAREWTATMERFGRTGAIGGVHGRCRVHQAELMRLSGPADEAERTALLACEELRPWLRREYGWPLAELGMIRLRRGDLAGAEEVFAEVAQHSWPPHPGLALLRLEQGRAAEAASEIRAAIAHPMATPSKELPPFGDLRLVPLLDAQAEIAQSTGDAKALVAAAGALDRIAERYHSPALTATAHLASARQALGAADLPTATQLAAAAVAGFVALDAPFEVARSRLVAAEAYAAAGDVEAARVQLQAARDEFVRYGASLRATAVEQRLVGGIPQSAVPTPAAQQGEFRVDGAIWIIALGGQQARLKDLKGLHYLRRLLAEPGREFHVLDLVATEAGTLRPSGVGAEGLPILDQTARAAYKRRLADIEEDIDEASRLNDQGRREQAEAEREYLINELRRAVGIGARTRRTGEAAERARTAVARTLRYALAELAAQSPPLAAHFRASLRTGTYCCYAPDPLAAVIWTD